MATFEPHKLSRNKRFCSCGKKFDSVLEAEKHMIEVGEEILGAYNIQENKDGTISPKDPTKPSRFVSKVYSLGEPGNKKVIIKEKPVEKSVARIEERELAPSNPQTDMMVARQAQEVQVAMLSAKRFPRDEVSAINRIKATCQRPTLAEQAIYAYPRGGTKVSGPSIRLAEALAQNWGNIDTGIIELENRNGKSEMMAYAWDLETNTRVTKTFSVEHKRDTKQGSKDLTDGRDIYEATANFGARRMRACILSVIPGDVVEMAVDECRSTIADADTRSPNEIIDSLIKSFKEFGVTKDHLEKYLGKQLTEALKEELLDFRAVYKAINDGQSKITDFFPDAVISAEAQEAIANAETKDQLDQVLQSLPVNERKKAASLAQARVKELKA